jgi:hypothetical protein
MKYIITIFICLLFHLTHPQVSPLPWNIVVYMEASAGHLYQAAFKNIDEIVRSAPSTAHVFIFLHTHGTTGWLYHVTKNNLHKIATIDCDQTVAQTLVNVMTKAINQGPAQRYGLVLWNHGYGILDPVYDTQLQEWSVPYDGPYDVSCSLKRSYSSHHLRHRGMCITNQYNFLSNTDMVSTFDTICNKLLNGQKLAFCGMDLCKGAMFEHAYQLCDYVEYLIGSQECEMVDGWPYDTVLHILQQSPHLSTQDFVIHTVAMFNDYYQEYTQHNTYTLSGVNTRYAKKLKHNIDGICNMLIRMMNDNDHVKKSLAQVRQQCKAFCDAPMYCDLYEWYSKLLAAHDECIGIDKNAESSMLFRQLLLNGIDLMHAMTVARCYGSASAHAHGCSIYFPQFALDASYTSALFAQDSYWIPFLEQLLL